MAFNAPVCSSETPSATAFGCIDQREFAKLLRHGFAQNSDHFSGELCNCAADRRGRMTIVDRQMGMDAGGFH